MRIRCDILASGNRWTAEFPEVEFSEVFPKNEDGVPTSDTDAVRAFWARQDPSAVTASSNDTAYLLAIAAAVFAKVTSWKRHNRISPDEEGVAHDVKRMERRARAGITTSARIDFSPLAGGRVRIAVRWGSRTGREVVADHQFERVFAWLLAEAAQAVAGEIAENPAFPAVVLDGSVNALLAELNEWRNERREDDRAAKCERRRDGYCSPIEPKCRWYRGGKCTFKEDPPANFTEPASGAGASVEPQATNDLLTTETEGRVSGGERAISNTTTEAAK